MNWLRAWEEKKDGEGFWVEGFGEEGGWRKGFGRSQWNGSLRERVKMAEGRLKKDTWSLVVVDKRTFPALMDLASGSGLSNNWDRVENS